ncbi:sigma 54-interacting transcriptional regulator [Pendulispora rubella]|uniref:Sigma 54-interacting transcriptional regulator n=1 Tax=Pendulispora rubella TaxID=2741070 RepID=A0ABZ2KU87_9BACT
MNAQRRLVVVGQAMFTGYVLPESGSLSVGRSEKSDVRIEDESISRKHARLHLGTGMVEIEDRGSVNGTRVRGERLALGQRVRILPGEAFHIGNVMVVIVADGDAPRQRLQSSPDQVETRRAHAGTQTGAREPAARAMHVIEDPAMQALYEMASRIAAGNIHVLVLGETGVGKELVAETIHERSPRHAGPFVCLNCAALSEQLLEAELFGYERGAFTGAVQSKQGLLESAHGGTVFLDEVGEMPMTLQAKLLRVLESRQLLRVGAVRPREVDVRFVAATNRDLQVAIQEGRFRSDLFFRLGGAKLMIPPLRERAVEIEPLAKAFAQRAARDLGRAQAPALSPEALNLLRAYPWPGNVRELRNFVERAVLLADGPWLAAEHFPIAEMAAFLPTRVPKIEPAPPSEASPASEREHILEVLRACAGNQSRAAKVLGIARSTLVARLDSYGVPRPRKT